MLKRSALLSCFVGQCLLFTCAVYFFGDKYLRDYASKSMKTREDDIINLRTHLQTSNHSNPHEVAFMKTMMQLLVSAVPAVNSTAVPLTLDFTRRNNTNSIHVSKTFRYSSASETPAYSLTNISKESASTSAGNTTAEMKVYFLTLFTSFKPTNDRLNIQLNTIHNWAQYPDIQPVAYTSMSNGTLIKSALQNGWKVFPVPRVNEYGTPFLRDLFFDVTCRVKSKYYALANADILFTEGLMETLKAVDADTKLSKEKLIIGRRINVDMDPTGSTLLFNKDEVARVAKGGELFRIDAEDYFIFNRYDQFPWGKMKNVVIGRPAFDNYLVGVSVMMGSISVVDGSNTILALHQNRRDGKYAGFKNKDGHYNHRLIGKFPYYKYGLTVSAHYATRREKGEIIVKKMHLQVAVGIGTP